MNPDSKRVSFTKNLRTIQLWYYSYVNITNDPMTQGSMT